MSTNIASPIKQGAAAEKTEDAAPITAKLSEDVTKGLSQSPSRAQVPPATAAEEIVQ